MNAVSNQHIYWYLALRSQNVKKNIYKCMDEGFLDQIVASSVYQLAIFIIRVKNG